MAKFALDGTTLRVAGELDSSSAPEFRRACKDLLASTEGEVMFDFSDVDSMTSSCLSTLMSACQRLAKDGRTFAVRPSRSVRRLLLLTGASGSIPTTD